MTYDRISGGRALLPEVSLFEAHFKPDKNSDEQEQYVVLTVVTHKGIFPHLEGMLADAMSKVEDGPEYIEPIGEKGSFDLPGRTDQVHIAFYQADSSIVDLFMEARPDDCLTGLLKVNPCPTMDGTTKRLLSNAEKYLESYLPKRIIIPDCVTEDFFYKEQEAELVSGEQVVAVAERDEKVGLLVNDLFDKLMTTTGQGNSFVDAISEIYAEFQEKYKLVQNGDMDDIKRMAMRRSRTHSAEKKFDDFVLKSPLQLTRFLALYDDRRSSPDSSGFYEGLDRGMGDLLDFERAIIDQGSGTSSKERETGRKVAACLLELWKVREEALISYEQSHPEEARERMEALSEAVDRMNSLDSMFKDAEAVVDAHLKKLKEDEEEEKRPTGDPLKDLNKGSDSSFGRLPPRDLV